jgi:uncharacterized flavoprotein (TIGR03862 family)
MDDAVLTGVETRTSSPIRITRGDDSPEPQHPRPLSRPAKAQATPAASSRPASMASRLPRRRGLGGGSWSRFGSDGAWVPILAGRDIPVAPLKPANCGFDVGWSDHFRGRHAGEPVKSVALEWAGERRQGEFVVTETGVEGSLIYGFAARLRDAIERSGVAEIHLDLMPDWALPRLAREIAHPRGARSLSSHLQSRVGLKGVKTALLREVLDAGTFGDPGRLAAAIKSLPLRLVAPRPLEEAISSAGGVAFGALDERLMVRALPGVFCAGEMLDWEAPTGGYLLTACFAAGRWAGRGALDWLKGRG